jgi:Flp pilus assembly protein TadG
MPSRLPVDFFRSDQAASLIEMAFIVPFLMALLLGTVDFARAYYLSSELASAAHAGAEYAAQNPTNIPGETASITNAVTHDAPDVPGLTVATPVWGCECSDGTSYSASCSSPPSGCSANWVYRITITASATYAPWFPWPGIPSSMLLSSSATLRSGGT